MLYKTPIRITSSSSPIPTYLTAMQVINIIREVFVNTFPNIFVNLVDALAGLQKSHALEGMGTAASLFGRQVPISPGVLKVQDILDELDELKFDSIHAKMRHLRLLIQLRTVYKAVLDPDANISSVDTGLQSIITDIHEHVSNTHIQSMNTKTNANSGAGHQGPLRQYPEPR